ncbi:MAG TPA: hypothetical protein VED40_10000 [Azospirillaceae bacterium]|nr:hypothetical protein [Azospirillaceae bacterium]
MEPVPVATRCSMMVFSPSRLFAILLLALILGLVAGLWDLAAAELRETFLILAASGLLLGALLPAAAGLSGLAVAAGVLFSHLAVPVPVGVPPEQVLPAAAIAAAVAFVPAGLACAVGALAARALARPGWWNA